MIAAAGDIACEADPTDPNWNGGDGVVDPTGNNDACRQKATSDLVFNQGLPTVDAVLTLGDTQYEDGTLAQFQGSYDPTWGRVKSITRPAIGNHEYQKSSNGVGYFDYFNDIGNQTGPAGDREKGYYSFNVDANWHVIALNSMCLKVGGCDQWSAQEQWLRNDLAANSGAACTIAYWHHPLFNSGPDGNYDDDPQNNTTALWQALYEAGADIVLAGHSHTWQHYRPQDAAGTFDADFGLREFVVGTGGKNLSQLADPQPPNVVDRDKTLLGVMKFVLKANSYDWSFVAETTGATPYSGINNNCHGAPQDTFPPDTRLSSGPDGLTRERNASFGLLSSDPSPDFLCKLDGPTAAAEAPCTSPKSYPGLADGPYTLTVTARDATGNEDQSPVTRSFTVDTIPPDTSISDGPTGTVSSTSATFTFGASEGGAALECRLDSATFVSCSSPQTYEDLAEGSHTFETRATDAASNTDSSPASRTFTVDVPEQPPATPATNEPEPLPDPTEGLTPLKHYRAIEREIVSGHAYRGRGGKRRLYVDDGERLEVAAAEKRPGKFVSAFYAFMAIGSDARDSLGTLTLSYNGGTSARNGTATLYVFNYRTRRWVEVFSRAGRRDRSFDWSASAFARDYVSRKGTLSVRVKGTRDDPFRTRTDLLELTVAS